MNCSPMQCAPPSSKLRQMEAINCAPTVLNRFLGAGAIECPAQYLPPFFRMFTVSSQQSWLMSAHVCLANATMSFNNTKEYSRTWSGFSTTTSSSSSSSSATARRLGAAFSPRSRSAPGCGLFRVICRLLVCLEAIQLSIIRAMVRKRHHLGQTQCISVPFQTAFNALQPFFSRLSITPKPFLRPLKRFRSFFPLRGAPAFTLEREDEQRGINCQTCWRSLSSIIGLCAIVCCEGTWLPRSSSCSATASASSSTIVISKDVVEIMSKVLLSSTMSSTLTCTRHFTWPPTALRHWLPRE